MARNHPGGQLNAHDTPGIRRLGESRGDPVAKYVRELKVLGLERVGDWVHISLARVHDAGIGVERFKARLKREPLPDGYAWKFRSTARGGSWDNRHEVRIVTTVPKKEEGVLF